MFSSHPRACCGVPQSESLERVHCGPFKEYTREILGRFPGRSPREYLLEKLVLEVVERTEKSSTDRVVSLEELISDRFSRVPCLMGAYFPIDVRVEFVSRGTRFSIDASTYYH